MKTSFFAKKFFSLLLIFSLTMPSIQAATTEKDINCDKSNKSEAEKNYCLVKQREIDNKGYSWDELGRDSLETLTVMIAAMAAITVQVSSKSGTENKCPVYLGRKLEPILVAAGGLLLIYAEIDSYFSFKTDCSDLLSAKGSDLAGKISSINDKAGPDPILSGSCTAENLKIEGQVDDYCRAKACTLRMKHAADQKVKHLDWVKTAYMSAATIELSNIVINLAKGVMCSLVYTSATVCANIQASDCYKYSIDEDSTVKSFLVQGPKRKKTDELDLHLVDTLNFNLHQQDHDKVLLSQLNHSANYVETLILLDDYRRLANGAVVSTSVDEYQFMNSINLNALDKTNQLKSVMKVALELTNQLMPLQKAQAKYDVNEILSSLGMAAGVSMLLMTSTKKAVTEVIKKAWAYPLGRVVYFGALYGLVYANQGVYKDRIVKELEKRSTSFDDKITELTTPEINLGDNTLPTDPGIGLPPTPTIAQVKPPKGKPPVNCVKEDLSRDPTCECLKANKCNDMKIPEVEIPDGESLPPSVVSSMKNMKELTSAFSRGDSAKADITSKNMTSGFAALQTDYKKLKNKLKEDQIKANQKPHDIDREIKSMQGLLLKTVADAMGVPAPANTNNNGGSGGDTSKKVEDKSVTSPTDTASSTGKAAPAAPGTNTLNLDTDGLEQSDLGLKDQTDKAELGDYQFKTDEINTRSEENIFKKISSRYLTTGYGLLLKEIPKENPKETKPVKKTK